MSSTTRLGGCHCKRVRFQVTTQDPLRALRCSCSICSQTAFLHVIVARSQFTLLSGDDALSEYRFNTGVARHLFCKLCGVKSFYVPRSHPDGISVNLRCLDGVTPEQVEIESFDGAEWEANIHRLRAPAGT